MKINIFILQAHNDAVTNVLFSPDGRWITSGSADSTVKVCVLTRSAVR